MEFTIGNGDTVKPHEREIGIETDSVSTLIRTLAVGMMVLGAVFAVLDRYTLRRHLLAGFPHSIFAVGPDPAP